MKKDNILVRLQKKLYSYIQDAFFTPMCSVCSEVLPEHAPLCDDCLMKIKAAEEEICGRCCQPYSACLCSGKRMRQNGISRMIKLFRYHPREPQAVENRLLFRLKHEDLDLLFGFTGEELAERVKNFIQKESTGKRWILTYCPRTDRQFYDYGFDQSYEIAKEISNRVNVPFLPVFKRVGHAKVQKKMKTVAQRAKNVKGTYRLLPFVHLDGVSVLLLDDIVTSGSTMIECASVLKKQAGAKEVVPVTVGFVPHEVNVFRRRHKKYTIK